MLATLNLFWVDGRTRPVTLMILPLQKQSLAIVQPSPGRPGPLLSERVRTPLLNLMMLKCLGLPIRQLNIAVLPLPRVVPRISPESFELQQTPLFKMRVIELPLTKLLFKTNVLVKLPGRLRIRQEKSTLTLELLFNSLLNNGKHLGAETIKIL